MLAHLKAGMPQESEDGAFAKALFLAVRSKTVPLDLSKGWGYQPPEDWKRWHDSLVATGGLKEPLKDLDKAYTNAFVAKWNEGVKK